jgi:hypothetical protein
MNSAVLTVGLLLALADADSLPAISPSATAPPETIHDPRTCPALFGDDDARAQARAFRERVVGEISVQNDIVTMVHSVSAWRDVSLHRRHGLTVSSIERVKVIAPSGAVSEEQVALVDVTESALPKGSTCSTGLYALSPDDSVGERGFVLLVDTRGVLVELDGRLGWLYWPAQRVPRSRLVWRSSFDSSAHEPLAKKRTSKTPLTARTFRRE